MSEQLAVAGCLSLLLFCAVALPADVYDVDVDFDVDVDISVVAVAAADVAVVSCFLVLFDGV